MRRNYRKMTTIKQQHHTLVILKTKELESDYILAKQISSYSSLEWTDPVFFRSMAAALNHIPEYVLRQKRRNNPASNPFRHINVEDL